MQYGGVSFCGVVRLELGDEMVEDLWIMGQQDNAAGVPVQPVNGMKAGTPEIKIRPRSFWDAEIRAAHLSVYIMNSES